MSDEQANSEETTELYRVPDMPGHYISSNAPHSGEFVPVATHDKIKRQRDALLAALKPFASLLQSHHDNGRNETPVFAVNGIAFTIGDLRRACAAIAAVESEK